MHLATVPAFYIQGLLLRQRTCTTSVICDNQLDVLFLGRWRLGAYPPSDVCTRRRRDRCTQLHASPFVSMGCYCGSALASFVNLRTAFKIVDRDALLVKLRAMSAGDDFIHLQRRLGLDQRPSHTPHMSPFSALAVRVRMKECARFPHVIT